MEKEKNTIKRHFESESSFLDFMASLDQMLSRISFNGERKILEAKPTTGSMIIRFDKFKTLDREGYYLGISKMGKVVLDVSPSEKGEGRKEE